MKRILFVLCFVLTSLSGLRAQINTERVMAIGRNSLYFEDYVLAIQYFNQVIQAKPYLAEPYFYRGVAKFYLDDYVGAEEDCGKALERNQFIVRAYICRSYARMQLGDFNGAVTDCENGLEFDTENKVLLYNKGLALVEAKRYQEAEQTLNDWIRRYPNDVDGYMARGEYHFKQGDTLSAIDDFSRCIDVNRHYASAWSARGRIYLMQDKWANGIADLNETLKLDPDRAGDYMNRGLARFNLNDLRGALSDLDRSIELAPNEKLTYLNRAIMRSIVGDLNRSLDDYDKAIYLDPEDYKAIYSRAMLRKEVGDYQGSVSDLSTILGKYPRFTPALYLRSEAKRRLGDAKGADRDYFAAWNLEDKLKQEKASGHKTNVTSRADSTSDQENIRKYNRMIVANPPDSKANKYENPMRGKVQDKDVDIQMEDSYLLTYYEKSKPGPSRRVFDLSRYLNAFHAKGLNELEKLLITNKEQALTSEQAGQHFTSLDEWSRRIAQQPAQAELYFARSLDYLLVQDLTSSLADLDQALKLDPDMTLGYFLRSNVRFRKMNADYADRVSEDEFASAASQNSKNTNARNANGKKTEAIGGRLEIGERAYGTDYELVLRDLDKVLQLDGKFLYAFYNRGNIRCLQHDYRNAINDYTKALEINSDFAEAWFNRGLAQIYLGDREHGLADLRMAGQLGIYKAYNIIKRFSE